MRASLSIIALCIMAVTAGCAHNQAATTEASPAPAASSAAATDGGSPTPIPPWAQSSAAGSASAEPAASDASTASEEPAASTTPVASTTPAAIAATAASVTPAASPGPTDTPTATPTPSPTPLPTANPNLLSFARGTFVRRWTAGVSTSGAESLPTGGAWASDGPSKATPEFVFELPAVAQISQINVDYTVPPGASATLRFATATTDDHTFTDAGTPVLGTPSPGGEYTGTLQRTLDARWLRVQIQRSPGARIRVDSITATGTLSVPPAALSGRWALADNVTGSQDVVFAGPKGAVSPTGPIAGTYQIATRERDGAFTGVACNYNRDIWRGPVSGGAAQLTDGGALAVVANGSLLIGVASGSPVLARRIAQAPACELPAAGSGPRTVILDRYSSQIGGVGDPATIPGHRFETRLLALASAADLQGANAAVLAMNCQADKDADPAQQKALLDFVAAGHVLVIRDADPCSASTYDFIPYPFTTSASGARGAKGNVLQIADSSVLASDDSADAAHYIDVNAYLKNISQQLGDADIMVTKDQHWCGLMFAKNAIGTSGWVRAYARYGKGVIVYDGFDVDDLLAKIPQAILLNRLAYGLSPNADLPCNAHVASQLFLFSSVRRSVPYGTAKDYRFAFTLDQEGSPVPVPVTLALDGERAAGWRATVDHRDVLLGKQEHQVSVTVHVPANATATQHLYTLTATASLGRTARAAIVFDVNEALAKELEKGGRARIYGIHFDVASARIQPQSEAVIREIALVLTSHPAWRMRVEGHTDSDGGAAYNLDLSKRRAESVRNDLIAHYHIGANRLQSAGYGLTRPVASNNSDAGKALNRRVELLRL